MLTDVLREIAIFASCAAAGRFLPGWRVASAGVLLGLGAFCICGNGVALYPNFPSRPEDLHLAVGTLLGTTGLAVGVGARSLLTGARPMAAWSALLALLAGCCAGQGIEERGHLRRQGSAEVVVGLGVDLCFTRTALPVALTDLVPQWSPLVDGWGAPLIYERQSDTSGRVLSAGRDGVVGSADDVAWRVPEDCDRGTEDPTSGSSAPAGAP